MSWSFGIMQGRLSSPAHGRIQSFPSNIWRAEFAAARAAGLSCIEWIYETGTDADNPLGTDAGIDEMIALGASTGVGVRSICADYYMDRQLVTESGGVNEANLTHLLWLVERAARLGARYMVLPFVDSSSLRTEARIEGLLRVLARTAPVAASRRVELHLETDLPPVRLSALLSRADHPSVRANYDIGNSASLGHDPAEELPLVSPWLGSVHIKDRVRGGSTVPLGTGSADFPTAFRLILQAGFIGPFILQTARGADGDEIGLAVANQAFAEQHLRQAVPAGTR